MNIENLKQCHFYSNEYVSSPSTVSITTYQFPTTQAFVQQFVQAENPENINAPHHWSFAIAIPWSALDPHKKDSITKLLPYHDIIMIWTFVVIWQGDNKNISLNISVVFPG